MAASRVLRLEAGEATAAVYDVRNRRLLGLAGKWEGDGERADQPIGVEFELEPADPELLALVSAPINGISLDSPPASRPGEPVRVSFRVDGPSDLRSVARFEVFGPDGVKRDYYSGNHDIVNGSGSAQFRPALNDPRGTWKIQVTEVISGVSGTATISLR